MANLSDDSEAATVAGEILKSKERQMNIVAKLISQTKKPTGIAGLILAKAMNRAHSRITNWGLSFLEIGEDWI